MVLKEFHSFIDNSELTRSSNERKKGDSPSQMSNVKSFTESDKKDMFETPTKSIFELKSTKKVLAKQFFKL